MKACEEEYPRVSIAKGYAKVSVIRVFFGLPFVYGPIVFSPFFFLSALSVYFHLRMNGAKELKFLTAFLPARESHRYKFKSQIVKKDVTKFSPITKSRLFWIFNCTYYCPVSVALLEWHTYLVKIVENWWCPFTHSRKAQYADAAIDGSYWHTPADSQQLHPEDRDNPIWNEAAAGEEPPKPGKKEGEE